MNASFWHRIPKAAAIAWLAALAAPAAGQTIEFQGTAIVYGFSDECREAGWYSSSQPFFMRYYPASLGDNPDSASFALNQSLGALGYRNPTGDFDNTLRPVEGFAIFGSSWLFDNASVRFNRQSPRRVTEDLEGPLRISGQIRNFNGTRRCHVQLDAVLMRTP